MNNLYFTPASGSTSSSLNVIFDNPINQPLYYTDVQVEITSSQYLVSGSSNFLNYTRIYVKSGSRVFATFPIEETNIIYLSTSSVTPPSITGPTYFLLLYNFQPDNNITSSLNKFEVYDRTATASFMSASSTAQISQIQLSTNNYYALIVSGSGKYYTTNMSIINSSLNQTIFNTSSVNANITASLYVSSSSPLYNYSVIANTTTQPYLTLTYRSSGDIPVSPSGSISAWNSYLGSSASSVSASNNRVEVIGGNLSSSLFTTLNITSSGNLITFDPIGMSNILTCSITNQNLRAFPTMSSLNNINYFDLSNNIISGTIPSLSNNQSLYYFDISNNKLTGSISQSLFSQNLNINYFDCSYNRLTGSIPSLPGDGRLEYFNCSYNNLSGSLSSLGASNLQYFNCSNNALTGSISLAAPNYALSQYDCSNNKLSGILSASLFDFAPSITSFSCSYNILSGSIPNFSSSNVNHLYFSNNKFTGSIDISGSSNLITFNCSNNNLSGSINSLEGCTNLVTFDYSLNNINGDIPRLTNAPNLETFSCTNNTGLQDYIYTTDVLPVSLKYFYASNSNIFKQSAVDGILYGLDASGATNGIAALGGATNAAPTVNGYINSLSLISKGWTVATSSLTSHSINIVTGSTLNTTFESFNFDSINLGQTFAVTESGALQSISLQLGAVGAPDFAIKLNLYDQFNGLPNNLLTTSTNTIAASSLLTTSTGSLKTFRFNNYILTGSVSVTGSYAIGLTYSEVVKHDYSNQIQWWGVIPRDYLYGYCVTASSSDPNNWVNLNVDFNAKSIITYLV